MATQADTRKLAKIMVTHELMHSLLGLPEDVMITSMHTNRGEPDTFVYMICDRFQEIIEGAVAPSLTMDRIENIGLWDEEDNEPGNSVVREVSQENSLF